MDWTVATLAVVFLAYAAVSGRVDGTPLTAAIVFVAFGLIVGPEALGLLKPSSQGEWVEQLAEATLTVVLFADASRIDLRALRRAIAIPTRLLGLGLPLTLVAGLRPASRFSRSRPARGASPGGHPRADGRGARTGRGDAPPRLPSRIRQGLNVESGLNDGICVPIFLIALAVARRRRERSATAPPCEWLVEEQSGTASWRGPSRAQRGGRRRRRTAARQRRRRLAPDRTSRGGRARIRDRHADRRAGAHRGVRRWDGVRGLLDGRADERAQTRGGERRDSAQ